ncbi:FecR family protein [Spirosoma validum]|uniref:DUF4974 domain-containing protein n=1 Tax=Spirosoma validum TaxID=2771355 RepID=A0A927B533_9BACT|nr:FecR domain-containing protein [Spirosoma validum]MBD2755809.1 DUF4974 domain-containing protein [Spirosoma validum]
MKPPSPISPDLLDKYLRNECNDQEKEQVEAWYATLRNKTDYIDSLPEQEQQQLQNETFFNIQSQLEVDKKHVVSAFSLNWAWAAGIAASIGLLLGIYITYREADYQLLSSLQTSSVFTRSKEKERIATIQFVNHELRPVVRRLPDSSSVLMRTGASITYPQKFDPDKRLATFSGEGFFDVRKDKSRPFFIQSGEVKIKVLGTSFNVKAVAARKVFQISVVTGRVQVSAPDRQQNEQQVILKPQQQAFFETDSKRLIASLMPVQSRKEIYEPTTIVFSETPLDQVVEKLQKRFNIQIRLATPKLASCRVSADFEQQSLPFIMEMLCTALDATYTMSDKTVVIDGQPCD